MSETFADPFAHFAAWFAEATASEPNDPNAMTLATATPDGMPSARIVLLKDWNTDGFVFYTNKRSRKGGELNLNPRAALLFFWKSLHRQIRIEGAIEDVTGPEEDAYYASRARLSRIGAWASLQSSTLPSREDLLRRVADYEAKYPTDIPRPPHWGGFRLRPAAFEFWQDAEFRLHDRTIYTPVGTAWVTSKLFP
jgi:pyridoxamine 5'-phosphate oxidase